MTAHLGMPAASPVRGFRDARPPRHEQLFQRHLLASHRQTDRLMLIILVVQWALAILLSLTVSPWGWAGQTRSIHIHVLVAVGLGALLNALPALLIVVRPGAPVTRQVIAVVQMLWSALLIHLTGGRIETHFHVFGSLAFLAFYRDWKVLSVATLVVVLDHALLGLLWPGSVYGVASGGGLRFLEHGAWVIFEDVVLILGCFRAVAEMRLVADREGDLEALHLSMEGTVIARTAELEASVRTLEQTQRQVMELSRKAGMAEVATSVLHNVGNVLNSVNVSTGVVLDLTRGSKVSGLGKAIDLMQKRRDDLPRFLSEDPKGRRLPEYLFGVAAEITRDHGRVSAELETIRGCVDHIKVIVGQQQSNALGGRVIEKLDLNQLVEDAIRFHLKSLEQNGLRVARELQPLPALLVDRHQVFQILVNLFKNAVEAIKGMPAESPRCLTVKSSLGADGLVEIVVADTGSGIDPAHLTKIFGFGFTTKAGGHGFGLHGCACAAREAGGSLTAESDGPGRGAAFTLRLPARVPGKHDLIDPGVTPSMPQAA